MNTKKQTIRLILNAFMLVIVLAAWLMMAITGNAGLLSGFGLKSLRYFTVLSNLFAGLCAGLWLKNRKSSPQRVEGLKFVAGISVFLTFTVVVGFLAPLYGFAKMYTGANLWFHLLVPLMAVFELIFLSEERYSKKTLRMTMLPPLIYGIFYLANILINGIGAWPNSNDWYGFLNWGYPAGMLIFAFICLVSWLLGKLVSFLHDRLIRH